MLDEVRAAFPAFTDRFEGRLGYMYTDKLGLVTTGRGNLIDTGPRRMTSGDPIGNADPAPALALPWCHFDWSFALAAEVRQAWSIVKNAWPQVQSVACERLTNLRLSADAIDALTFTKLDEMWSQLRSRFANLESSPAPAQLGILSMAWAMGPAFNYPRFRTAALAGDWGTCGAECFMQGPGIAGRNAMNEKLFLAARDGVALAEVL